MATSGSSPSALDIQQFFPGLNLLREEIAKANHAVIAVVQSVADLGDPTLAALFGIDAKALEDLRKARSSAFAEAIRSGLPLFSLRFTTPDVLSALRTDMGAESVMQELLRSIPVDLPNAF